MIKVYVYVVGLSLLKISSQDPVGVRVLFPAGGYSSGSINTTIHPHTPVLQLVGKGAKRRTLSATHVTLNAPCSTTPCLPAQASAHVPLLSEILAEDALELKAGCELGSPPSACLPIAAAGKASKPIGAAFDLYGEWRLTAAVDCPPDPKLAKPSDPLGLPKIPADADFGQKVNFLDAQAPWNTAYGNLVDIPTLGNAVLLEGSVNSVDDLVGTDQEALSYVLDRAECEQRTGRFACEASCVILLAENATDMSRLGNADPHFAAFYDLLGAVPESVFLPVAVTGEMCPPWRGGGAPGPKCVPAIVN